MSSAKTVYNFFFKQLNIKIHNFKMSYCRSKVSKCQYAFVEYNMRSQLMTKLRLHDSHISCTKKNTKNYHLNNPHTETESIIKMNYSTRISVFIQLNMMQCTQTISKWNPRNVFLNVRCVGCDSAACKRTNRINGTVNQMPYIPNRQLGVYIRMWICL